MNRPCCAVTVAAAAAILTAGCGSASPGAGQLPAAHQHSDAGHQHPASGQPGTVTGRLIREGGPIDPKHPATPRLLIPGWVRFTRPGHRPVSVHVGTSGKFSLRLHAGAYEVTGRSPRVMEVSNGAVIGSSGKLISGTERETVCSQPVSVVVTPQHRASVVVTCFVP